MFHPTVVTSRLRSAWWPVLIAICAVYAGFALVQAAAETLSWTGTIHDVKARAVPVVFVLHALAGAVALVTGALQVNAGLRRNIVRHRAIGRVYVVAVLVAGVGGLWSAVFFEVPRTARVLLAVASGAWVATTVLAVVRVRAGQVERHRAWMLRSLALTMFFLTFELWTQVTAATGLPHRVAYPLAVVCACAANLAVAEWRIHRDRTRWDTRPRPLWSSPVPAAAPGDAVRSDPDRDAHPRRATNRLGSG